MSRKPIIIAGVIAAAVGAVAAVGITGFALNNIAEEAPLTVQQPAAVEPPPTVDPDADAESGADAGPVLPESFKTFLFQKRFELPLRAEQRAAFWVDSHSCLELLEVKNANLRLHVSAFDDRGNARTTSAGVLAILTLAGHSFWSASDLPSERFHTTTL